MNLCQLSRAFEDCNIMEKKTVPSTERVVLQGIFGPSTAST